jgi:protein involved in polysaccharide export with SLBB domain
LKSSDMPSKRRATPRNPAHPDENLRIPMKTLFAHHFSRVLSAKNCRRSASHFGVVIMCLALNTICLSAEPTSDPGSALLTALTNELQKSPKILSQASTNDSQSDITRKRATTASIEETSASNTVPQASTTNAMDALDDTHTLAIGDVLSFRILEDEDEPIPLIVTDSGDLEAPYIGRFPAVNRTCKQLAREIKAALEKDYYYQATVIIAVNSMTKSRGIVYLVGQVQKPGPLDLPSDEIMTVSKAILRAGGFTDFADEKHVKITREGDNGKSDKATLVVNVGQIFDAGKTEKDVPLKPGDLIYIPERLVHY